MADSGGANLHCHHFYPLLNVKLLPLSRFSFLGLSNVYNELNPNQTHRDMLDPYELLCKDTGEGQCVLLFWLQQLKVCCCKKHVQGVRNSTFRSFFSWSPRLSSFSTRKILLGALFCFWSPDSIPSSGTHQPSLLPLSQSSLFHLK